jgi:hypothetical protein
MQPRPADVTTPPTSSLAESGTSGDTNPAEGRPDLGLPGADRQDVPQGHEEDLPERLGQRIENGSSSGVATGEPDVLPDVEVPEETM